MKKIISVLVLTLLSVSFQAFSASNSEFENIDGMFGYKFGQDFDNKGQEKSTNYISLGYTYKINVPEDKQLYVFNNYYVVTTPLNKKINGFFAAEDYRSNAECLSYHKIILTALKMAYGTKGNDDNPNIIYDKDNNDIAITVECVDNRLFLANLDLVLTGTAIKEIAALENKIVKSLK